MHDWLQFFWEHIVAAALGDLGEVVAFTVIGISMTQNLVYLVLLVVAFVVMATRQSFRQSRALWSGLVDLAPPITVIAPAFDEEATVVENVRSLMALKYPRFTVVLVNDGSNDGTLGALEAAFGLVPADRAPRSELEHAPVRGVYTSPALPNLLVVDKENGGKADALNAGLTYAESDLVCAVDVDCLLEADALLRVVQPFVEDPDHVVAMGGTVRVANGCAVKGGRIKRIGLPGNLLARLQTVEYLRAFMMARVSWGRIGALMIVSGAFGIFRRDVLIEVGGYDRHTVGEDLEVVVRIHRFMRDHDRRYRVEFVPDPVCWTQVPEELGALARQRVRWQRGAIESFVRHKDMMLKRRYGRAGMIGLAQILFLDILTPLVELVGYVLLPVFFVLGVINWDFIIAYLALTFAFGIFISVGSLILEEVELSRFPRATDLARLTLVAIFENFGYRQLNNYWRLIGHLHHLLGKKDWGRQQRRAFAAG